MTGKADQETPAVYGLARFLDWSQRRSVGYRLRTAFVPEPAPGGDRARIDKFTDWYVIACAALAIIALAVMPSLNLSSWALLSIALFAVSLMRILEIVGFHLRFLIGQPGHPGGVSTVASHQRSFLLALINVVEVTVWFTAWYYLLMRCNVLTVSDTYVLSILRESIAMMVANSTGLFKIPESSSTGFQYLVRAVFCFQNVVGLFLILVVLGRVIAALPIPKLDSELKKPKRGDKRRKA